MPSLPAGIPADPFIANPMPIDPLLYGFDNYYLSDYSGDELEPDEEDELLHDGDDPLQTASKKRAKELTRDERFRLRVLHFDAGWTYASICAKRATYDPPTPTLTMRQIQWACDKSHPLTPRKGQTQPSKVTDTQKELIKASIEEKREHRLIPWIDLPHWIEGLEFVRDSAIKRAMKDMGYGRKERQKKIVHTELHESERLRWAEEYKDLVSNIKLFYIQILTYLIDPGAVGRGICLF